VLHDQSPRKSSSGFHFAPFFVVFFGVVFVGRFVAGLGVDLGFRFATFAATALVFASSAAL
jgi:hypothetical protein